MKNQIQITETKKIFISILTVIGAVTIFTAPLLHIFFPKKPDYQVLAEKKITKFNKAKNNELCDLKEALAQGSITPLDYIEKEKSFQINRDIEANLLEYHKKINNNFLFLFVFKR